MRTETFAAIFCLALISTVASQTSAVTNFDGCTKNCMNCLRTTPVLPPPATNVFLKTCQVCANSSPKVGQVPLFYECSGPAIEGCEIHRVTRETGVVSCILCKEKFIQKVSGATVTCEAIGNDFENCRRGISDSCVVCNVNYSTSRPNETSSFSKKCELVPSDKRFKNCESYRKTGDDLKCYACENGYNLSADGKSCLAVPAEQQQCMMGWESNNGVTTCQTCNTFQNWYSVDAVFNTDQTVGQKQICAKQGGGMMLIIIIVIVLIVVAVAVVLLMRRGKSSNEAELRGSMISKN